MPYVAEYIIVVIADFNIFDKIFKSLILKLKIKNAEKKIEIKNKVLEKLKSNLNELESKVSKIKIKKVRRS